MVNAVHFGEGACVGLEKGAVLGFQFENLGAEFLVAFGHVSGNNRLVNYILCLVQLLCYAVHLRLVVNIAIVL